LHNATADIVLEDSALGAGTESTVEKIFKLMRQIVICRRSRTFAAFLA
jgi:hypothetical protein